MLPLLGTDPGRAPHCDERRVAAAPCSRRRLVCVYTPWRTLAVTAATALGLALLAHVGAPYPAAARWLWLLGWLAAMAWLLLRIARLVGDMFDDGRSAEVRGLPGLVLVLDVWLARELVLANLWFLAYVWPPGDYGRWLHGLEVYTAASSVWDVYAHVLAYSVFTTLSTGLDYATPKAAWVRVVGVVSGVLSELVKSLVLVVGIAESAVQIRLARGGAD